MLYRILLTGLAAACEPASAEQLMALHRLDPKAEFGTEVRGDPETSQGLK
jgi:hypothetical protein